MHFDFGISKYLAVHVYVKTPQYSLDSNASIINKKTQQKPLNFFFFMTHFALRRFFCVTSAIVDREMRL